VGEERGAGGLRKRVFTEGEGQEVQKGNLKKYSEDNSVNYKFKRVRQ